MTKQIAKLLKATIQESSDLKQIAKQLAQKGRGGDSMLVHITPREASMLKDAGGSGTINPDTGLMEFYQGEYDLMKYAGSPDIRTGGYTSGYGLGYSPSDFEAPVKSTGSTGSGFQETYSLVPDNYVPNPKTGGYVSPDMADVGGQYGVGFGRTPRAGTLTAPINPQIRLQQQAEAAAPPPTLYSSSFAPLPPEVGEAATRTPGMMERLKANLTRPETLEKLGIAGLQSLPAIIAARQASAQGRRAKEELQAMAEPYKKRGETMIQQAERGELTPVEQQQLQALQARAAQGAANRGGVGSEQAAVQIESFRQQLLANKYDMGIKIANIGDQIAAGAIKSGLQADQYVNELTSNYFQTLAMSMGGQTPFTQQPRSV
jgi:hypothetical protein